LGVDIRTAVKDDLSIESGKSCGKPEEKASVDVQQAWSCLAEYVLDIRGLRLIWE
jgi:hypothetical protein